MLRGTGATSSVIQAAGAPGGGVSARPNALVVLVKTKREAPAATASSSRLSVPVRLVSTKSCAAVRADVRLVQRRGVEHGVGALHRLAHERAVGDRADDGRVRRREHVEPDDLVPLGAEDADERLAEMPRAAGHEQSHAADNPTAPPGRRRLAP